MVMVDDRGMRAGGPNLQIISLIHFKKRKIRPPHTQTHTFMYAVNDKFTEPKVPRPRRE